MQHTAEQQEDKLRGSCSQQMMDDLLVGKPLQCGQSALASALGRPSPVIMRALVHLPAMHTPLSMHLQ